MASIQHLKVANTTYDIEDATVDTKLLAKADLVNGKVPTSELPSFATLVNGKVPETELEAYAHLVNGTVPTTELPTLGTVVSANPTLAGTESNLTGLEVAGTKYKVPDAGTVVVANPTMAGTEGNLTGLQVAGTKYNVPTGTQVVANPTLAGTESTLTGLQVGSTKYAVKDETARASISALETTVDTYASYSANEHIVGEFLGEDLYSRTVQFTIPSGSSQDYSIANYSSWGIDKIIKIESVEYSTVDNGTTFPTMWYNHNASSSPFGIWLYCANNQIIVSSTSLSTVTGGYVTLFYTKTA